MSYAPVEVRHVKFRRRPFGYGAAAVDGVLTEIVDSFEAVWGERAELADKVEHLETELARHRDLEALLRTTLTSAEQSAHELRDQARREAQLILDEAHAEARSIAREAVAERERLDASSRRIRALLSAALAAVEDAGEEESERPKAEAA